MTPPPHTAKSIVFTCMDERLEAALNVFIHNLEGGAFHAAMAGGGAVFSTEPDRTVALKQVVAAYKINRISNIYLQSHLDCGAYALAGVTFSTPDAEIARLYADLDTAYQQVNTALNEAGAQPGEVTVHLQVVDLAGNVMEHPGSRASS